MSSWLWSFSDPTGHEKKLKAQEQAHAQALAQLRAKLQSDEGKKAGQQLVQGGELSSADDIVSDAYLKKWLVAREWDVPLTYTCILEHARWRAHIMPYGYIDEEWVRRPLADERVFLQGRDRLGRALTVIQVGAHHPDKSDMQSLMLFTCYTMNAMMALCDAQQNPGRRLISIFDLSHCGYSNLDVAALRMILRLLSEHYVEQLDCMVFYNPPWIVWGIWASLKALLPEVTRSKIKFVDPADTTELCSMVPADVLPQQYGGSAALLPVAEAIRKFKLPPYPHLADVAGSRGTEAPKADPTEQQQQQQALPVFSAAAPCGPDSDDAAAEIRDDDVAVPSKGQAQQQFAALQATAVAQA